MTNELCPTCNHPLEEAKQHGHTNLTATGELFMWCPSCRHSSTARSREIDREKFRAERLAREAEELAEKRAAEARLAKAIKGRKR